MAATESRIVLTDATTLPADGSCPKCGAPKDRRVASSGFGTGRHDLCGRCGYAFEEFTRG